MPMTNSNLCSPRRALHVGLLLLGVCLIGIPRHVVAQDLRPPLVEPTFRDSLTTAAVGFSLRYPLIAPNGSPPDPWLGRDKAKHVLGSALWTLSTQYILVNKVGWTESNGLPASIASGAAIGITKEVYDASRSGRVASARDLIADALGIGLAVGIVTL